MKINNCKCGEIPVRERYIGYHKDVPNSACIILNIGCENCGYGMTGHEKQVIKDWNKKNRKIKKHGRKARKIRYTYYNVYWETI